MSPIRLPARACAIAAVVLLVAPIAAAQGFLHQLLVVSDTVVLQGSPGFINASAECPEGTAILGGGARTVTPGYGLTASRPGGERFWNASARPFGLVGATRELEAIAVCGRVANRIEVQETSAADSTSPKLLSANCPPGTSVLGGGALAFGPTPAAIGITTSAPSGNGWFGRAYEVHATDDAWDLNVYAICGTVPDRVLVEEQSSPTSLNEKTVTATCPPGRIPISGGAFVGFDAREVLTGVHPILENTWSSSAYEPVVHLENWTLQSSVICAPEPRAAAIGTSAIAMLVALRRRRTPRPGPVGASSRLRRVPVWSPSEGGLRVGGAHPSWIHRCRDAWRLALSRGGRDCVCGMIESPPARDGVA